MKLAIFDLDDTLIAGDSASLWVEYMNQLGWIDLTFLDINHAFMDTYNRGNMSMQDYMNATIKPLYANNRTVQDIKNYVASYVEEFIKPIIYPEAKKLIQRYFDDDYRIIIISATGEYLVNPIAKVLGITEVLAIQLEIKDGRYTGNTVGVLSYREGKVLRLKEYLGASWQKDLVDAYFYSDSHNDIPMFALITNSIATNPNKKLIDYAQQYNIPIINWSLK